MARKSGLGKGLDSLISSQYTKKVEKTKPEVEKSTKVSTNTNNNVENKASESGKPAETAHNGQKEVEKVVEKVIHYELPKDAMKEAKMLPIIKVERNPNQPRQNFDEDSLTELAESIRQFGILQPLLVTPVDDHYVIIAGERRWRAAKLAGLREVPVIVKDYSSKEIMEISLIENIQRENLNAIEEAEAYQQLLSEFGYRQEDLAEKLSRSRTSITNKIRLLKLSEKVRDMIKNEMITEGHARALLPLEKEEEQYEIAKMAAENHMSVRETERLVKKMMTPEEKKEKTWDKDDQFVYDKLEEDLRNCMGTKVAIQRKEKNKGKIVIDYYSSDELERIMELFHKL